jgi:hypothetical protein
MKTLYLKDDIVNIIKRSIIKEIHFFALTFKDLIKFKNELIEIKEMYIKNENKKEELIYLCDFINYELNSKQLFHNTSMILKYTIDNILTEAQYKNYNYWIFDIKYIKNKFTMMPKTIRKDLRITILNIMINKIEDIINKHEN